MMKNGCGNYYVFCRNAKIVSVKLLTLVLSAELPVMVNQNTRVLCEAFNSDL